MKYMTSERSPGDPWCDGAPIWPGSTWVGLAARAYVGARDGHLSSDVAFDLACFLIEWAAPSPVFGELAEASMDGSAPEVLANLARQALDAVDYVPDFAVEPQLLAALERMLAVVAHDVRATGLDGQARLVVLEGSEPQHAFVQYDGSNGHTSGLGPWDAAGRRSPADTLVLVADELQDAVMESLFAAWPVCPKHQLGVHPRAAHDKAVWWCSSGQGHVIAVVGKWGS
jgi:hypothetical protein